MYQLRITVFPPFTLPFSPGHGGPRRPCPPRRRLAHPSRSTRRRAHPSPCACTRSCPPRHHLRSSRPSSASHRTATSAGATRSACPSSRRPQPARTCSPSTSQMPRKCYTVALGEPIMKPRVSTLPLPLVLLDDDTEEDGDDALDRTIGSTAGRHTAMPLCARTATAIPARRATGTHPLLPAMVVTGTQAQTP
ncbi:hypothetical protein BC834DRAFT_590772 [Gloeopeniophorella convolvens]|nr:hypothetical protein BC834DRAFT_590772 [Gloeopeniophorella convolvens]